MLTEQSPFQYLPLHKIVPSRTNKRRIRQDKLQELADNIKANGVMQPILVRPIGKDGRPMLNEDPDLSPDHYEIVAGERRFRASQLAEQPSIPAMVRELHDLDALQLQVFENLHRDDLHPMEEAEAFEQLHKKSQDLIGLSVDELALKVHKSRSYIYASLKLLELCTYARDAFFDGKIGKETAVLVARIPGEKLQTQAVKEIVEREYSFRAIKQFIRTRFTLDLDNVRWDLHSTTLLPDAASCFSCPKRSGNYPELCEDIESPDVCTDPDCFGNKKAAYAQHLIDTAPKVIHGEQAKEIAPYGAHSFIDKGFCTGARPVYVSGLAGSYSELLGEDMPEPTMLIDHNQEVVEVYEETALKQKLQEKIDAGELIVKPAEPQEKSEWEIKTERRESLKAAETADRKLLFLALHDKLKSMSEHQLPMVQVLQLLIERVSGRLRESQLDIVLEAYGRSDQDYSDFLTDQVNAGVLALTVFLIELLAAADTVADWDYQNDCVDDAEDLIFLLDSVEIDPSDVFNATQPASPPPSAAQAMEQTREVDDVDEADGDAGQTSAPPAPAAPADEDLPPEFAEIRAKAMARKARRQKKEEPASAGADQKASAATATEETASPAKTTIAQRKAAAGWITNDARKKLVSEGKLRPGHLDGEKCMCCNQFNGNDRCNLHDIPTGANAYCKDMISKTTEVAA
jgi:ParB/RepB/Spo0J family partition protein